MKKNITEGISLIDNKIIVNWGDDINSDIQTNFNKRRNMISKMKNLEIFVAYKYNSKNNENIKIIRDAIKYNDSSKFKNPQDLQTLINKSIIKLNSINKISNFDVLITPKSSGKIANLISNTISYKYNIPNYNDVFVKESLENIKINFANIKGMSYDVDYYKDKLEKSYNLHGGFKSSKQMPQIKNNVYDFLKINDSIKKLITDLSDSNILIIDDVVTSGITFVEMMRLTRKYTNKKIIGFAFLGK